MRAVPPRQEQELNILDEFLCDLCFCPLGIFREAFSCVVWEGGKEAAAELAPAPKSTRSGLSFTMDPVFSAARESQKVRQSMYNE